jgi:hypothetical protein
MKRLAEAQPESIDGADQRAAALEIVRREAVRSGRTARAVLSIVRMSEPPTQPEGRILAAVRLLRSPHVITPHPCATFDDWFARYTPRRDITE